MRERDDNMATVQYVDTILQEMKVKSANGRKIIFDGEVNDNECLKACYYLDKLVNMDKISGTKEPITILIHTFGGSILSGNLLLGKIKHMQDKLGYTIIGEVGGMAMSMGFQILQQCKIRKCYSYSRLMFHQPLSMTYGDLQNQQDDMEETQYLWEVMKNLVTSRTNITNEMAEEWKRMRKDKYFSLKELKELNIVDEIIDL